MTALEWAMSEAMTAGQMGVSITRTGGFTTPFVAHLIDWRARPVMSTFLEYATPEEAVTALAAKLCSDRAAKR